MTHLMKRIEYGSASSAYQDYLNYCAGLINQPIKRMSNLGESLLKSLDYENLKERQIKNFRYLHAVLRKENKFEYDDFPADTCPLSYMFYSEDPPLEKKADRKQNIRFHLLESDIRPGRKRFGRI